MVDVFFELMLYIICCAVVFFFRLAKFLLFVQLKQALYTGKIDRIIPGIRPHITPFAAFLVLWQSRSPSSFKEPFSIFEVSTVHSLNAHGSKTQVNPCKSDSKL